MELTGNLQQPVWRALFHPTRRQIIRLLQEKSRTTGELSDFFDVTRYAVMKHLRVLEQAELIHVRREGRLRWNDLNAEKLQEIPADYMETWRAGEESQDSGDEFGDLSANVSTLEYEVVLPAPVERVYQAFLDDINAWWPDRRLADSKLILEPFVGGRFYEANEEEESAELLGFISCLRPKKEIRLFGPVNAVEEAAISNIRIQMKEADGRTHLFLTHHTAGEVNDSLNLEQKSDWENRLDHHLRAYIAPGSSSSSGYGH